MPNASKKNDLFLRLVMCALAAHFITVYNEERSFFELLFDVQYLRGVIGSFVIAFLLTQYVNYISQKLDRRLDWVHETIWRLLWQILLGFTVPAIFAFLFAAAFFAIYNINILSTTYLKQDYALILLMITAFNLLILAISFFRRSQAAAMQQETDSKIARSDRINHEENNRIILMVDTLTKTIPLPVETICYLYILKGSAFARTFNMESINDSHPLSQNLRALEQMLDARMFFRINRQMIINFSSCKSFSQGSGKSIAVTLDPPPYKNGVKLPEEHKRLLIVSEERASAFRLWMDR